MFGKLLGSLFVRDHGLVCPRCEKPMEGHSEKECERKMSRRFFFGTMVGAVAAVTAIQSPVMSFGVDMARGADEVVGSLFEPWSGGITIVHRASGSRNLDVSGSLLDGRSFQANMPAPVEFEKEFAWSKDSSYVNPRKKVKIDRDYQKYIDKAVIIKQ